MGREKTIFPLLQSQLLYFSDQKMEPRSEAIVTTLSSLKHFHDRLQKYVIYMVIYIQQTLTRKCHFFVNFMEIDLQDEFKRNSSFPQGQRFAKIVKEVKAVFSILSSLSLHQLFMFLVFYYGINLQECSTLNYLISLLLIQIQCYLYLTYGKPYAPGKEC